VPRLLQLQVFMTSGLFSILFIIGFFMGSWLGASSFFSGVSNFMIFRSGSGLFCSLGFIGGVSPELL
jgi:hypothetical protein